MIAKFKIGQKVKIGKRTDTILTSSFQLIQGRWITYYTTVNKPKGNFVDADITSLDEVAYDEVLPDKDNESKDSKNSIPNKSEKSTNSPGENVETIDMYQEQYKKLFLDTIPVGMTVEEVKEVIAEEKELRGIDKKA